VGTGGGGPLAGVRVLDLARVLAGPYAAMLLADLGAEVIKVERPKVGDDSRAFGPPWVKDKDGRETKDSAYFTSANRGKKSITVNVAKPEGQELIRALARECDVLIENYKHGDLARYGLGYDDLKSVNPQPGTDQDGKSVTITPKVWMSGNGKPMTVSFQSGCGRVLFSTYHTESGSSQLLSQEKALLYVLLEVGVCVGTLPPPK